MAWSVETKEGFATGPSEQLVRDGVTVDLFTVWTTEGGVEVGVDVYAAEGAADGFIPAALAGDVAAAIVRLAGTPAPEAATT